MRYRQLDANSDFTFGGGLKDYLQDSPDAVVQAVLTRFRLWEGEWFLDVTEGTPYLSGMLGKYTQDTIDQLIKKRILETQGVDSIIDYSGVYDGNNRSYSFNATISTIYGTADIRGAF
jgi:hypothetical protein